jgi:hypothetical protein
MIQTLDQKEAPTGYALNQIKHPIQTNISLISQLFLLTCIAASYLIVTGLVAYLTFFHALLDNNLNTSYSTASNLVAYLIPLISGVCLLLVLLRPFFPLSQPQALTKNFSKDTNNLAIAAMIENITTSLDSHATFSIEFTLEPKLVLNPINIDNILKNNFIISIGLPLLLLLNQQQLNALLTNEIAQISSKRKLISKAFVTNLQGWFVRSIDNKDGWLDKIKSIESSGCNNNVVGALLLLARAAIWANNYYLRMHYSLAHRLIHSISSLEQAQLDSITQQKAGTNAFIGAIVLTERCEKAAKRALSELSTSANIKLSNNYPEQVAKYAAACKSTSANTIERVALAKKQIHHSSKNIATPAQDLLPEYRLLCQSMTPSFYRSLGLKFSANQLSSPLQSKQRELRSAYLSAINNYTASIFNPLIMWDCSDALKIIKIPASLKIKLANTSVASFRQKLPEYQESITQFKSSAAMLAFKVLLQHRYEQGYINEKQLTQLSKEIDPEIKNSVEHRNCIKSYAACSGIRIVCSVLLTTDKEKFTRSLVLINQLRSIQPLHAKVNQSIVLLKTIDALQNQITEHAEVKLKTVLAKELDTIESLNKDIINELRSLYTSNSTIKAVQQHIKFTLSEFELERSKSIPDPTAALAIFLNNFKHLNVMISGQLVHLAISNEKLHNIHPIRLVPKPTSI